MAEGKKNAYAEKGRRQMKRFPHEKCYVCGREIQEKPQYIGQENYRHRRCFPGSARWMAVQKAKPRKERSALYPFFMLVRREKEGSDEQ